METPCINKVILSYLIYLKHQPCDKPAYPTDPTQKGGTIPRAPPIDPPPLIDKYKEITGFDMYSAGGGGALPIFAYTGRLCPKGIPFTCLRYIKVKRVWISQDEVYKG